MYQNDIIKIQNHKEFENYIDYNDIYDVKIIKEKDEFRLQIALNTINGVRYTSKEESKSTYILENEPIANVYFKL